MAFSAKGYYYDNQLRSYMLQFMAIFSGIQVNIGGRNEDSPRLITVPIHYSDPDRVVAAIIANNTQNAPIRLPTMSARIRNMTFAADRAHGVGTSRRESYVPLGGLVPDDIQVIDQRAPTPYNLELELNIMTSNTDQMWQILEQIMVLFDPQLIIQTSDDLFDMSRVTSVTLTSGPSYEHPHPSGQDIRYVQTSMTFEMPAYFTIPTIVKNQFVEQIKMRIGAVGVSDNTNIDIIEELDSQLIPYATIADASDLTPM